MPSPPEVTHLRLGMMPLLDALPLVVARERGDFARNRLQVTLSVEASWATVRDKLAAGMIDAAHLLSPMPLAATAGIDGVGVPILTGLAFNLNGNSVAVSRELFQSMALESGPCTPAAAGAALRQVLRGEARQRRRRRVLAHVFPFSSHHYQLRHWLAASDIDPDHDVSLVVIPPHLIVQSLREGRIDGCCVGAPWTAMARRSGLGVPLFGSQGLWRNGPEKVLAVTAAWAAAHPETHLRLLVSVMQAARWLDEPANRREAAEMMVHGGYLDAPLEVVEEGLEYRTWQDPAGAGLHFHAGAAGFPWLSHAGWLLEQAQRWQQVGDDIDVAGVAAASYRPDLYREAAAQLGISAPLDDRKPAPGRHQSWQTAGTLGVIDMDPDASYDLRDG